MTDLTSRVAFGCEGTIKSMCDRLEIPSQHYSAAPLRLMRVSNPLISVGIIWNRRHKSGRTGGPRAWHQKTDFKSFHNLR